MRASVLEISSLHAPQSNCEPRLLASAARVVLMFLRKGGDGFARMLRFPRESSGMFDRAFDPVLSHVSCADNRSSSDRQALSVQADPGRLC